MVKGKFMPAAYQAITVVTAVAASRAAGVPGSVRR
jgi:hypothetical protein